MEINDYNRGTANVFGNYNVYDEPEKSYKKKIKRIRDSADRMCAILSDSNTPDTSKIDWENPEPTWSSEFKKRYLILMIQEIGMKFHIVLGNVLRREQATSDVFENAYFEMDKIFADVTKYIFATINDRSMPFLSLKNFLYLSDTGNPSYGDRYKKDIVNAIDTLLNDMETKIGFPELSDDIAIDTIVKLSFMISTGSRKLKVLPKFKSIEGCTVDDNISGLIRELGKEIMKREKMNQLTTGFNLFIKANPLIQFSNGDTIYYDELLTVGYRSLEYLRFLCSGSVIDSFIYDMVH